MKRKHAIMSNGQRMPRMGGKSVYRLPRRAKNVIEVTPAGTGMAREQEVGDPFPPLQVPAKSANWRVAVYRAQTGRRLGVDAERVLDFPHLYTAAERARALGLTGPQRRRYDQKRNKADALPKSLS